MWFGKQSKSPAFGNMARIRGDVTKITGDISEVTGNLRGVKVLTANLQPTIMVGIDLNAGEIDELVKRHFGAQPNGSPHNWFGCESLPSV